MDPPASRLIRARDPLDRHRHRCVSSAIVRCSQAVAIACAEGAVRRFVAGPARVGYGRGMPPILEIKERRSEDGALLLALVGELDLATVPALGERLQSASASREAVVLDLAELEFMDSAGLRLLLEATADASRDG